MITASQCARTSCVRPNPQTLASVSDTSVARIRKASANYCRKDLEEEPSRIELIIKIATHKQKRFHALVNAVIK